MAALTGLAPARAGVGSSVKLAGKVADCLLLVYGRADAFQCDQLGE